MMKVRTIALSVATVLAVLALVLPAKSQMNRIIVNKADATSELSVAPSADLNALITSVGPRFVVQYANALRYYGLGSIPNDLQTLLGQARDRFIIQYANANRYYAMRPISNDLQTLLEQVEDRLIVQYANTNRAYSFTYPLELMGDTTPPRVSDLTVNFQGAGTVKIEWTTDEFATSAVLYGTQPGVYSQTVSDPLYAKRHEITLIGLIAGITYYYQVRSTDRSGNTYTSSENRFTAQGVVYLPLVQWNSW